MAAEFVFVHKKQFVNEKNTEFDIPKFEPVYFTTPIFFFF